VTLAQKGRRDIVVNGVTYRFAGGWRQQELLVAIEAASDSRCRMIARFDPFALTGEEPDQGYLRKEHVRWAILEARKRGWDPQHKGRPFEIGTGELVGSQSPCPWTGDEVYEELLAAVLRDPEDDAPRLVMADWLIERGDPRGELVRQQCQPGAAGFPPELRRYWRRWSAPLWPLARRWTFRRGFVESLQGCSVPAREAWEALHRLEPVRSVGVRLCPGQGEALQWLPQPGHLDLQLEGPLGPDEVSALLRSPCLGGIRSLRLRGMRDESVAVLAQSDRLAGLRELELSGDTTGPLGPISATALMVSDLRVPRVVMHGSEGTEPMVGDFVRRGWRLTTPGRW
jgi:uncharacterized protein (TIGR02996 family)